jgi:lipoprotein signal peptidase
VTTRTTPGRRQLLLTALVLTLVVLVDQLTKWWAWRHEAAAQLNPGSTGFLGSTISGWYTGELAGAVLDLISTQILVLGTFALLRRPRPLDVLLGGALMIGGWSSNLLDRLGLHLLTAPGSWRGAIDFLPLHGYVYNLADVCITAGTLLFAVALLRRSRGGRAAAASRPRPWRRARRWALLAAFAPVLLGTAATFTASGGHLSGTAVPVVELLTGRPAG